MLCSSIKASPEPIQTTDATPVNITLFELTEHASSGGRLLVVCRRPSDGATKVWSMSTTQRRDNNAPVNLGNAQGTPFGAALDLTALLTATIAFFTDGVNVGVTATGIAATTLEWCVQYDGMQLID